eukprot:1156364-Pelagomonas_calceolata.AAC.4
MDKSIKSCLLGLLNLNAPGIDCDLSIGGDGTEYKAQFFKHVGEHVCGRTLPLMNAESLCPVHSLKPMQPTEAVEPDRNFSGQVPRSAGVCYPHRAFRLLDKSFAHNYLHAKS